MRNTPTSRLAGSERRAFSRECALGFGFAWLETPGALLTRSHLRELGLERRAVDAVFRELPTIVLPGYSRPMVRAEDYRTLLEASTYRGDRVRT